MPADASQALAAINATVAEGERRIANLSPYLPDEERAAEIVAIRDQVLQSVGPHHRALDDAARRATGTSDRAAGNAAQSARRRITAFLRGSTTPAERLTAARAARRG